MSSPFQQHLGTNYVPSIHEIRDIRNVLEVTSKEVCNIDAEIHQLQQQLHLLQEKRSKVYNKLQQHRALLSPARRLTRDALEQIFLACRPSGRNPFISATEAPMLLTQICSSWRSIAHSTPRLWAAIHVVLPTSTAEPYSSETLQSFQRNLLQLKLDRCRAVVKSWLDRSHEFPLSLCITSEFVPFQLEGQLLQLYAPFIASILVPYSRRWFDIDLCIKTTALTDLFKNRLTESKYMPMLKNLHITANQSQPLFEPPLRGLEWRDIVGLLSPTITCATFSGQIAIDPSDLSQIPKHSWKHLTQLNLDIFSSFSPQISLTKFAFGVISHCPSLQTLKLNMANQDHFIASTGSVWPLAGIEPVVLPSLTILALKSAQAFEALELARHLRLPSLKQLDFELFVPSVDIPVFQQILEILLCSCDLQSLGLYNTLNSWISEGDIVQILKLTPSLKSLRFSTELDLQRWPTYQTMYITDHTNVINDNLLYALSPAGKDYSDIICPQLEVLECNPRLITGISEDALKVFVKARRGAHLRDKRVAALTLQVPINELKQKVTDEEIVSLGEGSAIYFRKGKGVDFSPCQVLGYGTHEELFPRELSYEVYSEL